MLGAVSALPEVATFPLHLPPTPHWPSSPYLLATSYSLPSPQSQPTARTQGSNTLSTCLWAPDPWRVHRGPSYFAPTRHKEPPKELESASSDEENEDGDFTVYECPGLAPVSARGEWRGLSAGDSSHLVSGLAARSLTQCLHRQGRWRCATHCLTILRCQHQCLAPIPHRHCSDS